MKNWTIRQRIIASFAAILALLLAMVALAYVRLDTVDDLATRIEHDSLPGLDFSGRLNGLWIENHLLTHQLLLRGGHESLDATIKQIKDNATEQDRLFGRYDASVFDEADRSAYQKARNSRDEYFRLQNALIVFCQGSPPCTMTSTDKLDQEYEQVAHSLAELGELNRKDASASVKDILAAVATAHVSIVGSLLVTFLLVAFSAYYLISLIGRLQRSSVRVHTSATEIAATAREQQATATEIAATTTEIGATSKEIAATSRELVRTMGEVAQVAENSADLAGTSQSGLSLMEETMQNVIDASGHINAKLAVLNEKAGNIGQVVTTITKVADQTNLLSLNAAIEAEKAGEYGRGFAVVATEIRRLADQAAVATYDIEQMVKDIQSAVSGSVMGMDKFSEEVRRGMLEMQRIGAQLSQLIGQVQALAPRFESVSEGMQAQATGAEQITQALTQLSEASQQTVESLSQSSQAIEELNRVASGLRSGTGQRAREEA